MHAPVAEFDSDDFYLLQMITSQSHYVTAPHTWIHTWTCRNTAFSEAPVFKEPVKKSLPRKMFCIVELLQELLQRTLDVNNEKKMLMVHTLEHYILSGLYHVLQLFLRANGCQVFLALSFIECCKDWTIFSVLRCQRSPVFPALWFIKFFNDSCDQTGST